MIICNSLSVLSREFFMNEYSMGYKYSRTVIASCVVLNSWRKESRDWWFVIYLGISYNCVAFKPIIKSYTSVPITIRMPA